MLQPVPSALRRSSATGRLHDDGNSRGLEASYSVASLSWMPPPSLATAGPQPLQRPQRLLNLREERALLERRSAAEARQAPAAV
jgi:hypothetical protein